MGMDWFALHVKPHKERFVADLLAQRRIEHYYPFVNVRPVNPRSRKERPFFPGYLFVRLDVEQHGAQPVQWIEGTHGLVQFGGRPATVPETLIAKLRARVGRLKVESLPAGPGLHKGQRVRVVAGPFEGYEAVFDAALPGKERVQILLAYLSRQPKLLELGAADVVPVPVRRP
jgi:transcriptional antiterminator RfaH